MGEGEPSYLNNVKENRKKGYFFLNFLIPVMCIVFFFSFILPFSIFISCTFQRINSCILCIGHEKNYRLWFEVKNHHNCDSARVPEHKTLGFSSNRLWSVNASGCFISHCLFCIHFWAQMTAGYSQHIHLLSSQNA